MTAADRPSVTDNARDEAAAALRSTVDLDPRSDFDRGYAHGWHAAAEWAADRAETTTATTEDAEEVLHGAGWFARADLDPRDLRGILHDLADADLLATARTLPTREELSTLILSFLKPPKHSGGSWTLNPDDAADAVLALFRGGDK